MAISRQRKNVSYGVGQPLYDLSPQPIVSTRAPGTSDMAEVGTVWVRKSTNQSWVLASIVSNSATWTPMTVNGGATITTGNLTVTAGDVVVTAGDITATAGDITATAGDIVATAGGITATAGDITATAGDVVVSAGDITVTAGAITAGLGDITATLGDVVAGGDLQATGDVVCRSVFVAGDEGTGTVGSTTLTNVVDTTLSTGAGVVLMKTANPGDSSGWLKIYVGTDIRYIPYWTNLSP